MTKETLDKMKHMRLLGMARAFQSSLESEQTANMTTDQMISFLITSEWDDRQNRNIERQIRNARFRYQANVENIYYDGDRNLDKNLMERFAECAFVEKHEHILITGSTGIGKSYIASALGHQACSQGYKVLYANASKLFAKLKMAKADGSYIKEVARIERQDLLILDDFGLQPMDNQNRSSLMEIIEDRHGKGSVVITSQVPVHLWYEIIGEKTIADAILDRIVHDAHRVELCGESLRKKKNSMNNIN
ncbi:MAG: ATP-binding protein [Bacteroidetes bacterium]|nr:ATP-binding protein [Bacteroidota bacterium]